VSLFPVQSSVRQKEDIIPELKPSMARAPKLRKRTPIEQLPGHKIGRTLETYDPKKHNK
jgi:hypothetical protein